MTSQLNVDTIVDKAGSGGSNVKMANTSTYVSDGGNVTQNTVQGLAKHWSNFKMAATFVANDSFNQSSLTDVGAGTAAPVFTNNMANTTYSDVAMTTEITTSGDLTNKTAATYRIYGLNSSNAASDPTENCTIVVGDLA